MVITIPRSVKNRRFSLPEFYKQEDETVIKIETDYFILTYVKNSSFSTRSLTAKCKNSKEEWYYGQKEVRNLRSAAMSLDDMTSMPQLEKGLFSLNGIATIDDSKSLRFDENRNVVAGNTSKDYIDIYLLR